MVKYIDKATVVAEIERLREEEYPCDTFEESTGYYNALDEVSSFLDTLEVKEVDIEKIIEQTYYDGSVIDTADIDHVTYESVALHFYELGLKAQKGGGTNV